MRGYILHLQKHRAEDLIVTVLTKDSVLKLYRFYGVRHSPLQLGNKIDFVYEQERQFIPRLRSISHLGFKWLFELNRVRVWQQFMLLLNNHLKGVEHIDSFYMETVEQAANNLELQNPKRVVIEAAIKIFRHEGRLKDDFCCLICDEAIRSNDVGLVRALSPVHTECIYADGFNMQAIKRLFATAQSIMLDDDEIDRLWRVLEEGL